MLTESDWNIEDKVLDYLAQQLVHGRLSIFLGAGVSFNFGLPSWAGLVEAVSYEVGRAFPPKGYPATISLSQIASHLRTEFFPDDAAFSAKVKECLYDKARLDFESLSGDKVFASLGALTMASSRGGVSTVVSLNYDDALELYLEGCGFVVDSVQNAEHWASRADVAILHPHGFLPSSMSRLSQTTDRIIFDQLSFSGVVGRPDNPWFQRIATCLRSSTALLIGLGGNDPNLFSLLSAAAANHPRGPMLPYNAVALMHDVPDEVASTLKQHSVKVIPIRDYSAHLPGFLYSICQKAASIRSAQLDL